MLSSLCGFTGGATAARSYSLCIAFIAGSAGRMASGTQRLLRSLKRHNTPFIQWSLHIVWANVHGSNSIYNPYRKALIG